MSKIPSSNKGILEPVPAIKGKGVGKLDPITSPWKPEPAPPAPIQRKLTNESDMDLEESPMKRNVKKEPLSYNPDLVLKDDQESPKKKKWRDH